MQETKVCFFCLLHNSTFIFWSFSLPVSCFHSLSIVGFVNFEAWWQHWFWQFISVLITAKQKEPTTFKIRKWSMVGFPFFFFFFLLNFWQLTVFWWALQGPACLHSCCGEFRFLIGLCIMPDLAQVIYTNIFSLFENLH